MGKIGRPRGTGKYKSRYDHMAYVACTEGGFTDVMLAKLFQVSKSTINNWKHKHPTFLDSIRRGKEKFDREVVEVNLMKRVTGCQYTETTKELMKDGTMQITKIVKKEALPDLRAIIFFLKNRAPDKWTDKSPSNRSGSLHLSADESIKQIILEIDGTYKGLPEKSKQHKIRT